MPRGHRAAEAPLELDVLDGGARHGAASPESTACAGTGERVARRFRLHGKCSRLRPPAPAARVGAPDHYHQFRSHFVPCPDPIDPGRLRAVFEDLSPRVLRAKGFVVSVAGPEEPRSDPDVGPGWIVVQASGRTVEIEAWFPRADQPAPTLGIVFIGLDDLPAADDLRAAVGRASISAA